MKESYISTPVAVLIGSVLISISILISSGGIRFSGLDGFKKNSDTSPKGIDAQTNEEVSPYNKDDQKEKLVSLAGQMNLNKTQFKSCLEQEKFTGEIKKDITDAQNFGADATPTFFVGKSSADGKIRGVKIVGAQPFSVFKTIIDEQLSTLSGGQSTSSGEIADVFADDDPVLGNPNAPLTLVEFSDYECPFCKRYFDQTYPQVKKEYIDTGKLKLVFRDLALSFHDPAATFEANAANCAKELGGDKAYFEYHDLLFKNTKSNGQGII